MLILLRLWVGYFIYFKFTCVLFYFMFLINGCPTSIKEKSNVCSFIWYFNGCSSPIEEMNRLIWNGMSSIYYWKKLTFSKHRFSWKENLKKCTNFEEQKSTNYIRGNLYIGITVFSCLSSTKLCLRFLLNGFVPKTKGFCRSSFGNEVDFKDIMNASLHILAKN